MVNPHSPLSRIGSARGGGPAALLLSPGQAPDPVLEQMGKDPSTPLSRVWSEIVDIRSSFRSIGATPPPAGERPPISFPGFTVLGSLGQGGFGAVYRALDEKLGREVAVKVLHPRIHGDRRLRSGFLEEARVLARVRHPNVLTIHAVLEEGERIGLVMELISGKTLEKVLEEGPLSAGEAVQVGVQVCRALAAVHAAGLIHRDVKTANLLRESGGRIVLTDFGLGTHLGRPRAGEVVGTPLFMSPEQADGLDADGRSDLYSLGVVLYRLVTNDYPYRSSEMVQLLAEKFSGAIRPLQDLRPDLPRAFVDVVHRALRRQPEERFRSAGEMEEALAACLTSEIGGRAGLPGPGVSPLPLSAAGPSPPSASAAPGQRWTRRRVLTLLTSAALATAIVAAGVAIAVRGTELQVLDASLWLETAIGPPMPLEENTRIKPGDKVFLRFRADRDVHLYLFNRDDASGHHLFPRWDLDLKNPLPGGVDHKLPNETKDWRVTGSNGKERFYLVASRKPMERIEAAIARAEEDERSMVLSIGSGTRGTGGLVEAGPTSGNSPSLVAILDELDRLSGDGRVRDGVWFRKIVIDPR